jgi:hypothetical protein
LVVVIAGSTSAVFVVVVILVSIMFVRQSKKRMLWEFLKSK